MIRRVIPVGWLKVFRKVNRLDGLILVAKESNQQCGVDVHEQGVQQRKGNGIVPFVLGVSNERSDAKGQAEVLQSNFQDQSAANSTF